MSTRKLQELPGMGVMGVGVLGGWAGGKGVVVGGGDEWEKCCTQSKKEAGRSSLKKYLFSLEEKNLKMDWMFVAVVG